jgi:hypothetical protein
MMDRAVLAIFLFGACQASRPWELASISFKESNRPAPRIGVISPEIPDPELNEKEDNPDSLQPLPSYEMPNFSVCKFFTHFFPFCKSLEIRGGDFHKIESPYAFFGTRKNSRV